MRRPNITLEVPTGALLNQEITLTCTAAVDATITLMVTDSEGTNLAMTEVDSTGNSRSVNVTVMATGQHTVTCVADNNGLMETATEQFYGISKLQCMIQVTLYVYSYVSTGLYHCIMYSLFSTVVFRFGFGSGFRFFNMRKFMIIFR